MSERDGAPQGEGGQPGELGEEQRQEVAERKAPSALILHEAIREEGEEELTRSPSALAWSGLAAGMSMSFSLITEGLLASHLPDQPWRLLIAKWGYPIGFLIVVVGQQQLFTENTLTVVLPLLHRRNLVTLWLVLRLWLIVLLANVLGVQIVSLVLGNTGAFSPETRHAFEEIGWRAMEGGFGLILLKGIFAGWLIALMVWLLPGAGAGQVAVILIITYLVGLGRLTHIIAGSAETTYLVTIGALPWWRYLGGYFLPTLIGNVLGGVALVAALNHAQVVAGPQEGAGQRE